MAIILEHFRISHVLYEHVFIVLVQKREKKKNNQRAMMLITRGKHHCIYHAGPPFAGRFARVVDWWLPLHGCTGPSPSTSPRALILWLDHVAHRRRGRARGGSLSLPGHRQGEPAGCSGAEGLGLHPRSVGLFSQLRFPLPGRKGEGKGLSSG